MESSFFNKILNLIYKGSIITLIILCPLMGIIYCIQLWNWLFPTQESKEQKYKDENNIETINIIKSKKSAFELYN